MPFAEVTELDLRINFFPLIWGKVAIKSLEMKRPKIELICNEQGMWNFSTAGKAPSACCTRDTLPLLV